MAFVRIPAHLILDDLFHLGKDIDQSSSQDGFGKHFHVLTLPDSVFVNRFLGDGRFQKLAHFKLVYQDSLAHHQLIEPVDGHDQAPVRVHGLPPGA